MLRIQTLGGLATRSATNELGAAAKQPRRLAVLALIASAGERGVPRDRLLSLLWPDAEEESARRSLNQSLYALRKDLGADELFDGIHELRLNPALATCDAVEFAARLRTGALQEAVALYAGPFLDGFRLPGASEFERWIDEERVGLARSYADALERLAQAATKEGDSAAAATWWRKRAAMDPLNARIALELMRALAAAGERAAAIQHARIYEALIEQELDLPPDRSVIELAEQIRATSQLPLAPIALPATSLVPGPSPAPPAPARAPNRRRWGWPASLATLAVVLAASLTLVLKTERGPGSLAESESAVLAVGRITDYTSDSSNAAALSDMLATNLARTRGLRVIGVPQLYALLQRADSTTDLVRAAQKAGAGSLLEGSIYRNADGKLRLDLRRIDLASGAVLGAYMAEGYDLFVLADSGTAKVAADLGIGGPDGALADVTTHSVVAYRLYTDGLREYYRGDRSVAERFFASALEEDSSFAMAAYYYALSPSVGRAETVRRLAVAVDLASRAPDRERLIIRAAAANFNGSVSLSAIAETLAIRYPATVEGHFYRGLAGLRTADLAQSLAAFRRVLEVDSLGTEVGLVDCAACLTYIELVALYLHVDSFPAAIRVSEEGRRRFPNHPSVWMAAGRALAHAGRYDEAVEAFSTASRLRLGSSALRGEQGWVWLLAERYDRADPLLRQQLLIGPVELRDRARNFLALSLRAQGRLREALEVAREIRARGRSGPMGTPPGSAPPDARLEAFLLADLGRPGDAAVLYDSIARWRVPGQDSAATAANRILALTQRATILAAAGDTTELLATVDELARLGPAGDDRQNRSLHQYVRGLLLTARRDHRGAAAAFRQAYFDPVLGYSRINLALADSYLALGRPRDAVVVLQAAARSGIGAWNSYVSRTEVHERLARAWEAAGRPDSAAVHWERVATNWAMADPELEPRAREARENFNRLRAR